MAIHFRFQHLARFSECAIVALALLPLCPAFRTEAQSIRVGAPAPAFTATDSRGQAENLAQFRGKYVVLEWHNQGCPYTLKHYTSGNMQSLQKEWTAKGVMWFTVISSAPGKQGYLTSSAENAYLEKVHAAPTAVLMDSDGKVGRLYDAKTTPQMIVINPEGNVIYDGAIDDRPTPDVADIRGARNYVTEALTEAMAGKPVATPHTQPYGCSVKYQGVD
jgi:peroxiredoxin